MIRVRPACRTPAAQSRYTLAHGAFTVSVARVLETSLDSLADGEKAPFLPDGRFESGNPADHGWALRPGEMPGPSDPD
jgi:hypothetical protein